MHLVSYKVLIICHLMVAVLGICDAFPEQHHHAAERLSPLVWNGECKMFPAGNRLLNNTNPLEFNCFYDPTQLYPVSVEVTHRGKKPDENPIFVSVQQKHFLNAWTLPITFPVHNKSQPFNNFAELLCPPLETKNETLHFRITTDAPNVTVQVILRNESYELKKKITVKVTSSPVHPQYRLYRWDRTESSILITADSFGKTGLTTCAILALQNAKCPVDTDECGLRCGRGRYQTFTKRAGMLARKADFPDGVHVIVLSLPDDEPCTLETAIMSNRTDRKKTVALQVYSHATISSTWYIYVLTAAALAVLVSCITKCALIQINRSLTSESPDDERNLLEESMESIGRQRCQIAVGVGAIINEDDSQRPLSSRRLNSGVMVSDSIINNAPVVEERRDTLQVAGTPQVAEWSSRSSSIEQVSIPERPAFAPPTTYAPHPATMNFTPEFNPQFVWWWKRVAFFEAETAESQVAEVGFQNNLVIMAVFAALPTTELIRFYLMMMVYHGMEDQCYFNSRCLIAFGRLPDFSRIFSNIGYIFTGIAFIIIVRKHQKLSQGILSDYTAYDNVGVSRHYGLFSSLGYGLVIQGIMSALYHACPNSVTIRFDMMFMYVAMVAAVVCIWGLRHGDVTHHVYPTMMFIGLALLLAEAREWVNKTIFWTIFAAIYTFVLVTNSVVMARYGIWSFSPYKMYHICKEWKPVMKKLDQVLRDEDRTAQPIHILRIVLAFISNIMIIAYGCSMDPNVYTYILLVCLINMGLYFGNYIITKRICYRERGTLLAWISFTVSFLLWILALVAFFFHSTDSEASPSASRALNTPCTFFGVYDMHDAWHMTSALALFLFFLGLLTLDDDLCHLPSKKLYVF